eukprot:CAMPEP_0198594908 /NCGR_PEP_ID=MMETSP1462-20131121/141220_1 /TAXON_ID=1333877 /ORGANISM="Brandtodinium nutriculum, Strain RCC3387" /LENGTH=176 /DNA_ID=CAMNT_0044326533 /DNA_START=24 /DNA_END=551 /DNA_ORIENTATION=-
MAAMVHTCAQVALSVLFCTSGAKVVSERTEFETAGREGRALRRLAVGGPASAPPAALAQAPRPLDPGPAFKATYPTYWFWSEAYTNQRVQAYTNIEPCVTWDLQCVEGEDGLLELNFPGFSERWVQVSMTERGQEYLDGAHAVFTGNIAWVGPAGEVCERGAACSEKRSMMDSLMV